jgi:hypothetical protein
VPLRPTFLLENLPLWFTEFYKKVGRKSHEKEAQLFGFEKVGKSWASRIALNSL